MGMGAIIGAVGTLLARLTAERAAYLNALNLGGVWKVASEEHWTDARAGYISDMKGQLPNGGAVIASSNEVAKEAYYTQALATKLGLLRSLPHTNGLVDFNVARAGNTPNFFAPNSRLELNADYKCGYRRVVGLASVDGVYGDIVGVSAGCWLWGIMAYNATGSALGCQLKLTADGVVTETSYTALNAYDCRVLLGSMYFDGSVDYPCLAPLPLRVDSNFLVQLKAENHSFIGASVIYTRD